MKSSRAILFILLLIFAYSCNKEKASDVPYYNTPDFTPLWLSKNEAGAGNLHKIAGFKFIDQDGNSVTNETFKDKIYIANFFFTTCPGICPKMTTNLISVQKKYEYTNDVKLISHSVMPWADSVKALKLYEKNFNLKNGMWYLVTGKTSEIYELARKSYFAEEEPGFKADSTEFLHTEHVLLVDKKGHLRGVYNATLPLEIERLIEDIDILKKDG